MSVTDESRHELHQRLEEVLGPEQAATLMAHLPPVGWADVATKRDLDALAVATKRDLDALEERTTARFENLELRLDGRFENLEARMATMGAELRGEFQRDLRVSTLGSAGVFAALVALIQATTQLL